MCMWDFMQRYSVELVIHASWSSAMLIQTYSSHCQGNRLDFLDSCQDLIASPFAGDYRTRRGRLPFRCTNYRRGWQFPDSLALSLWKMLSRVLFVRMSRLRCASFGGDPCSPVSTADLIVCLVRTFCVEDKDKKLGKCWSNFGGKTKGRKLIFKWLKLSENFHNLKQFEIKGGTDC